MVQNRERTQSPGERRAAEAHIRSLAEIYAPSQQGEIASIRRRLRKRIPAAHEIVYEYRGFFVISFSPSVHGYEGILALHAGAEGLRLYFNHGKELPDPEGLLQGAGKQARWLLLEKPSTLSRKAVASLIDEAITSRRVAFEREGRGMVVVQSTTAQKQRAGRS